MVEREIVPAIQRSGWTSFDDGRFDFCPIDNPEDLSAVLKQLRKLDEDVQSWLRRDPGATVLVDFTGGTKVMTAGLILVASRWPCRLSYVGGKQRTKNGTGTVVDGSEVVVSTNNPADRLAWWSVDTALSLIRHHAYAAARNVLQRSLKQVADPARQAELSALELFADTLAEWDRFQHQDALNLLKKLPRRSHDLEAALGKTAATHLLAAADALQRHLEEVVSAGTRTPGRPLLKDLLANAKRRMEEGRWDDAVARLYRVVEATAQLLLAEMGIPDTSAVPLDRIPEPLQSQLRPTAHQGKVKLGLRNAWALLTAWNHPAASLFQAAELGLHEHSPLNARNQSILAHGFQPVSEKTAQALYQAALKITQIPETDLPGLPAELWQELHFP